ncbi:MAG: hypothetical protein V4482_06275 [Pseudomonadota bacterium]
MHTFINSSLIFFLAFSDASPLAAESVTNSPSAPSAHPTQNSSSSMPDKSPPIGESFSLMLTEKEQQLMSNTTHNDKHVPDETTTCYYLGGFAYSTAHTWTLWLNEKTYSNESVISGVTILNVSREGINLKANNSKAKNGVWLKMDQTFCCDTGQILTGDQRR